MLAYLTPPWMTYSILSVFLWGMWGLESKFIVDRISPWINQVVFSFGLLPPVIWVILSKATRQRKNWTSSRGAFYGLLTGVLGGLGNVAFYLALARGGKASIVVPLVGLAPLATVVLALIFLKETLNRMQMLGLVFALISIFLLSV